MLLTADATYENGTLRLDEPLPLRDNERVKVIVETTKSTAQLTYGLIGWTGDPEIVRRIALDPEFGLMESK